MPAEKHLKPLRIEHGYRTRFQGFRRLMRHRIGDVLPASSLYDLYPFEKDGRFNELISADQQRAPEPQPETLPRYHPRLKRKGGDRPWIGRNAVSGDLLDTVYVDIERFDRALACRKCRRRFVFDVSRKEEPTGGKGCNNRTGRRGGNRGSRRKGRGDAIVQFVRAGAGVQTARPGLGAARDDKTADLRG